MPYLLNVTRDLGFMGLTRRTAPLSRLVRKARESNPDPYGKEGKKRKKGKREKEKEGEKGKGERREFL